MSIHSETRKYEVVVVGGGLAGVCAAIAAARKGARTAIIQNRSMFGGNASSEIRMHIVGANSHGAKKNLGETGILLEILLANKRRNPYASFPVFDSVIWEKVHFQENLESFLNTNMDDVILEGKKIKVEAQTHRIHCLHHKTSIGTACFPHTAVCSVKNYWNFASLSNPASFITLRSGAGRF